MNGRSFHFLVISRHSINLKFEPKVISLLFVLDLGLLHSIGDMLRLTDASKRPFLPRAWSHSKNSFSYGAHFRFLPLIFPSAVLK